MDELGTWHVRPHRPDGNLKVPTVCLNGYGRGNHPLNVLLSGLGYALFLNLKNLLLINRLIDHGIGWFSFDLGSSKDFGGPKIRAGMMKEEGI